MALLALALLALPVAPMRHAAMAGTPHGGQAAAAPCPGHDALGHDETAEAPPGHQADGGQPCDHQDGMPGLSCCAAALCAGLQGAPPPAPVAPLAVAAATARRAPPPPARHGRDIPPALRPPRVA